uniref:Uncharacterized protein n=1 Tax=Arundo donax TaxID=35708 RepID=A0A0A8ZAB7_ARUDO
MLIISQEHISSEGHLWTIK